MNFHIAACVSNDIILQQNLLKSEISRVHEVSILRGERSASQAYNRFMDRVNDSEGIYVFPHQDIFFPPGWENKLRTAIEQLSAIDPNWGVLGAFGVTDSGQNVGNVFCAGLRRHLTSNPIGPIQVQSVDELLIIVRGGANLRFDENLEGFHLYGTDICQIAASQGKASYIADIFCIHNTNSYKYLPNDFWRNYRYLRTKWSSKLPITTPCVVISNDALYPKKHVVKQLFNHFYRKRMNENKRVADPEVFLK